MSVRRTERGAVAVEFALILPLLAMFLLGTVTVGVSFSHHLGLTNAVREGARFGATTPYPPPAGVWADDVIARTRALQFDDPGVTTRVCVDLYKVGTGSLVSACDGDATLGTPSVFTAPSGTPSGDCVVRVWAARYFDINAVLVSFEDKVMSQQAVSIYEREPCGTP